MNRSDGADPVAGCSLAQRDRRWSAADVRAGSDAVAAALSAAGVGAGTIVAHQFGLEAEGVVALRAIVRAGAIPAPAHPEWTAFERDAFLDALRPAAALTRSQTAWPAAGWVAEVLPVPRFGEMVIRRPASADPNAGWDDGVGARPGHPRGVSRLAGGAILATSGTGGVPRYVVHDGRSLRANAEAANERLGFGPEGRWLATLAWAHVGGLAVPLRAEATGATVGLASPPFDAAAVARALAELEITHLSLVPAMLHGLLDAGARPPGSLRAVLLGGAATPPSLRDRALEAGWPIALTYGLTEAGSQVATATPREVRAGDSSCGRPLRGVEVRIRPRENRLGSPATGPPRDRVGHIQVRGPTLFRGYVGAPEQSSDAWFSTGDLGHLDSDGRLHVTGRLLDRIVSAGANVDPVQVEAVLAAHPEVREAAVIGLPDDRWGQVVAAVVVGKDRGLVARLDPWCRRRLSSARVPRRWEVVERLPRTATGKVDRPRLRALLTERSGEISSDPGTD